MGKLMNPRMRSVHCGGGIPLKIGKIHPGTQWPSTLETPASHEASEGTRTIHGPRIGHWLLQVLPEQEEPPAPTSMDLACPRCWPACTLAS